MTHSSGFFKLLCMILVGLLTMIHVNANTVKKAYTQYSCQTRFVRDILKKPIPYRPVQIYFHRGTRVYLPENTIPAYQYAVRMGAHWLDADIQLTQDKQLVIIHDFTLPSYYLKNKHGLYVHSGIYVKDNTLAELQSYYMGLPKKGTQYARLFPHQLIYSGQKVRIPTLAHAIEAMDHYAHYPVMWQLEVKTDPTNPKLSSYKEITQRLVDFIETHKLVNRVEVQAFDWRVLKLIHQLNPSIHTAALLDRTTVSFAHRPSTLDGVWTAGMKPEIYHYNYVKMAKLIGAYNFEPFEQDITPRMIRQAHQNQMKVVTWHWAEKQGSQFNYNEKEKLIIQGVDGLIVDTSGKTQALIAQYNRQAKGYPNFICQRFV